MYSRADADGLTPAQTLKVYKESLANVKVTGVLNTSFPAARAAWKRLRTQHPVDWNLARIALAHAFTGKAAVIYEEIAARELEADEQDTWNALEARLFNKAQVQIKRTEFETVHQKQAESVEVYADRIRTLAACLPEEVPEAALCQKFQQGLLYLRREAAIADQGDFDDLVSRTVRLASMRNSRERVHNVEERATLPQGDGSRDSPIGPAPDIPPLKRLASIKCHRCHRFGHLATGAKPCQWPVNDVVGGLRAKN